MGNVKADIYTVAMILGVICMAIGIYWQKNDRALNESIPVILFGILFFGLSYWMQKRDQRKH